MHHKTLSDSDSEGKADRLNPIDGKISSLAGQMMRGLLLESDNYTSLSPLY